MIRYILVDDNSSTLSSVKSKIDTISKEYNLKHIESYDNSKKAFETISNSEYDLLIVDFEMPVYNGVELAKEIAQDKDVIFLTSTTSNEQTIINNVNVSGYLSKPFDILEFQAILKNKVLKKSKPKPKANQNDLIRINIGVNKEILLNPKETYFMSTALISYAKSELNESKIDKPLKDHVHIYGKNDTVIFKNVKTTVKELDECLSKFGFQKTSRSTIINTSYIQERDNTHLKLRNCKTPFEISSKEKQSFILKLRNLFYN